MLTGRRPSGQTVPGRRLPLSFVLPLQPRLSSKGSPHQSEHLTVLSLKQRHENLGLESG